MIVRIWQRVQDSLLAVLLGGCIAPAHAEGSALEDGMYAEFQTSKGTITLRLEFEKVPLTVMNFVGLAEGTKESNKPEGTRFYDGTKFHRVIEDFMIQGGGMTADKKPKASRDPIINEADNGLKNLRGTVAMARTNDVNSATSQFFINVEVNGSLDYKNKENSRSWGYAVFGRVVDGMDVVDNIRLVATDPRDVPIEVVLIESVEIH